MDHARETSQTAWQRCAIDTVDVARIERWLDETPPSDVGRVFTAQELDDAGEGRGRVASLAARFAAKEACQKLFPRETALGQLDPQDFSVASDSFGATTVVPSERASAVMSRARVRSISVSLSHSETSASAVAMALRAQTRAPLLGRLAYRLLPFRRAVIEDNLRRVFGTRVPVDEIRALAQAHYAHLLRLAGEFLRYRWYPDSRKRALVRVDNVEAFAQAWHAGRGVLVLTGHFGNFEVSTVAVLMQFPEVRHRIHFVRRPIKPGWLDTLVNRRMRKAGFGTIGKRGSLDRMLALLEQGDAIVFPFDQHARRPDGIDVEFFGHAAGTFKSLAIIALATRAPVVPAASWREADGTHVLRFEPALPLIELDDTDEAIRRNTRAYNQALERLVMRQPEQWWWVHRRWKASTGKRR
ncbi:MAG TPA: 4'-phosphopantetheinyl transferase superfamily protein [Casimicrobiaceae bacterium]|nr:4'-phosphopantetheinyl transferase superfamily protein [Casimicrobiaceae bacterium]